jgi:drug/metabolite transporter (DMT)-like permease
MTHLPAVAPTPLIFPRPRRWLPYAGLAIAVIMFSFGAIFVRLTHAEGVPTLAIVGLRYGLSVSILTPYMLTQRRAEARQLRRRDLGLTALAGIVMAFSMFFSFSSLEHTTVLISNVLSNSSPLWVALMEVLLLKAFLGRRVWLGLGLALAGALLFALAGMQESEGMGAEPLLGGLLGLGAALTGSVYFVLGRNVRARVPTLLFVWIGLSCGGVIALLALLFSGTNLTSYPLAGYFWILVNALGGQIIGHSLLAYVLAHLPATIVTISLQALVVISAVLAAFFFGEYPGPLQVLAGLVILAGVMIVISSRPPNRI